MDTPRRGDLLAVPHARALLPLADAPARVLVDSQIAHPAFAEGIQSALMRLERLR